MKEKWMVTNFLRDGGKENYLNLRQNLALSKPIVTILMNRGVQDIENVNKFFNFSKKDIPSTSLIKDATKCIESIHEAIIQKKHIVIIADYDTDGVTSGSILVNCLRNLDARVDYFTSNRFTEGYGISKEAIARMLKIFPDVEFVITVDNGIVAFDGINELSKHNIDCVVLDHHEPSDTGKVPECLAVCDVKQKDDTYPFKDLCGAGLAYKIMSYLYETYSYDISFVDSQLDLVAIGTIGDMVTLMDENRYYVKEGLKLINEQTRLSLAVLINEIKEQGANSNIDEMFIGFYISPTINAMGRIEGEAIRAIELFTTEQRHIIDNNSHILVKTNEIRKSMTSEQFLIAEQFIKDNNLKDDSVLIIYNENFHEGLVGLVAGRIKEKYMKPTIVLTKNEEKNLFKGSARSVDGFNIKEVLDNNKDVLIGYGGHAMAAGVSILEENLAIFREKMNKTAIELEIDKDKILQIDTILNPNDLTVKFVNELEMLRPFGMGFEKPVFGLTNLNIINSLFMGKDKTHLKLIDDSGINILDFNGVTPYEEMGEPLDIKCIGYPSINDFRNQLTVQFIIDGHRIRRKND